MLGGERRNHYVIAPGPGHSPSDRSLKIWIDDAGHVCCTTYSTADTWPDAMDYVRARLGLPPFMPGRREEAGRDRRSPEERLAEAIASWQATVADHRADDRMAARLWAEAIDPTGTPGEQYLAGAILAAARRLHGRAHLEISSEMSSWWRRTSACAACSLCADHPSPRNRLGRRSCRFLHPAHLARSDKAQRPRWQVATRPCLRPAPARTA